MNITRNMKNQKDWAYIKVQLLKEALWSIINLELYGDDAS
jgi:hypothetical protein